MSGDYLSLLATLFGAVSCKSIFNCTPHVDSYGGIILWFLLMAYMFKALGNICGDFFVPSLEVIVGRLQLSDDVAGATFMAAGATAPQLFTSSFATLLIVNEGGVGTIIGSAIFTILVIVGMTGLSACKEQELLICWYPICRDSVFYLISIVELMVALADEEVKWYESVLMLITYLGYCFYMKFNPLIVARLAKEGYIASASDVFDARVANSGKLPAVPEELNESDKDDAMLSRCERLSQELTKAVMTIIACTSCLWVAIKAKMRRLLSSKRGGGAHELNGNDRVPQQVGASGASTLASGTTPGCSATPSGAMPGGAMRPSSHHRIGRAETPLRNEAPLHPPASPLSSSGPLAHMRVSASGRRRSSCRWEWQTRHYAHGCCSASEASSPPQAEDGHGTDPEADLGAVEKTSKELDLFDCEEPLTWLLNFVMPSPENYPWALFTASIFAIGLATYVMVDACNRIGVILRIPPGVMGLIFLAAGTSIPDALGSLMVAKLGRGDVAVAHALGPNVFGILIGLGMPWTMRCAIGQKVVFAGVGTVLIGDLVILLVVVCLLIASLALNRWYLTRKIGVLLLVSYGLYVLFNLVMVLAGVKDADK